MCLLAAVLLVSTDVKAQNDAVTAYYDSVEVSLLTCQPHEEIYSLYGHTALRYHDLKRNEDWAFNYGIFNFHAPHFVLRFVFGLTDYELGVIPTDIFKQEYRRFGSQVTEQVLNLTNEEKHAIHKALYENYRPENRVYRYNYFYDNCTTRARDMVERNINGQVRYQDNPDYEPTYREMVRECTMAHPWATWGNDFLLGIKADLKTDQRQQEFLPNNLLHDFARAQIIRTDGRYVPLVKETRQIVPSGVQIVEQDFPLTPTECAIILLIISLLVFAYEWKKRRTLKWWDILLMTMQGLMGLVLFVMIFSQHPTTSINLQILLFNPLPLFYIYNMYRRKKTHYWNLLVCMVLLFYIGGIWQDYAEGLEIVALCLLIRYWSNLRNAK
ncbi:MAG: DUF4105 domain-containing protein [Prevotella sp.]|nr:DUF4105 domain-containing protein [Prevotella sp.]